MKKPISVLVALVASLIASGAEFKHAAATVDAPGVWEKDKESSDDTLILNSKPQGQQIVVSILSLKKEATDLDQIADAAAKMLDVRLKSAQKLSGGGVKFDNPEVSTTDFAVVCVCRGYAAKDKVRMAFRIEGASKTVRSISVYDYTGQSADEFQKWSTAILAGVK
jgi:hypothetical protein